MQLTARLRRIIAALCASSPCSSALAQATKLFAAPASPPNVAPSGAGTMAQATLALLLVLIAVFVAAYLLRRLRKFGGAVGAQGIEVVSQAVLGSKERAVLIKVAGAHLLVGVTPGSVNLLHVLDVDANATTDACAATAAAAPVVTTPSFKSLLKKSLGLS